MMPSASPKQTDPAPQPEPRRGVPGEVLGFVLSLIWLGLLVVAFRVFARQGLSISDTLGLVVVALAVFLPIILIWLAVLVLRAARQMRDEAARVEASVDNLRRDWAHAQTLSGLVPSAKPAQSAAPRPLSTGIIPPTEPVAPKPVPEVENRIAMFTSQRKPLVLGEGDETAQPVLALENPLPRSASLSHDEFIRAMNFPQTDQDEAGFAALRRALEDHRLGELVRAAQDVLTVLAKEGIYMDDLTPDLARPEIWRSFALGARGEEIADLGGIRDRSVLALTYQKMRADSDFRDACHRFLRGFDRRFTAFEVGASDAEISRFAQTRSARAFMLLGRVTGIFG